MDYECGDDTLDNIDVLGAITDGRNALSSSKYNDRKIGLIRGGSVGAVVDGKFYGVCHRKAWLRKNGIESPLPLEIEVMTESGIENETIWLRELRASNLARQYEILSQEEFDCHWKTLDGTIGKGSPDVVIFADPNTKKPMRGLELKQVSSASKATKVHYNLVPDTTNLIQTANYSLRMGDQYNNGVPLSYQLVYSSRVLWHFYNMKDKVKSQILSKGWDIGYNFGRPMTIQPFHRIYNLKWEPDKTLSYWTPGLPQWVNTPLTRESIDNYYMVVSSGIDQENRLGPKPTTKHINGSKSYSPCGYCEFNSICSKQTDISPTEFRDLAKQKTERMWKDRLNLHKSGDHE
jgi:hypothetical protein